MASKSKILGLTVEIGGDTTQLGKALEDVNKKSRDLSGELGQLNKLLKVDPGNVDLLAQKQKVLAEAVQTTKEKLDKLKDAEVQVQKQFEKGEATADQVRELQREIAFAEQRLKSYERAVEETTEAQEKLGEGADGLEDVGKEAQDAAEKLDDFTDSAEDAAKANAELSDTLNTIGNVGLGAVAGVVGGAVTALTAAAEETREYRTEMGKLDAAFSASGYASGTASAAYKELVGVIGETDQSVEAAQQIALLANSEQDVSKWAGLAAGVVGKFGDALQPETFFESANETLKLGEATGAYTQMLEGCGMSVEDFNAGLAACSSAEEKQAYMLATTEKALGAAGEAYKTNNADVIAANKANEEWTASLAQVGAEVEPLLTKVKSFGAELLEGFVPAIQFLLDNLPMVGVVLAGVTAAMASYKIAALAAKAASEGMTLAQYAMAGAQKLLNAVFAANPFGIIILGITALVAAFMYLWKNCESFRNFWINLWNNIKTWTSQAIDAVVGFFKSLPERAQAMVTFFQNLPYKIGQFLGTLLGNVARWVVDMAGKAKEAGRQFLENVVSFFRNLPTNLSTFLQNVISKVSTWGTNLVTKGKTAAKDLVSAVVNGIKELPTKMATAGKNLVEGLWNGIKGATSWIKQQISGFCGGIVDGFKSAFGINSPSKKMMPLGEGLDEGLAVGMEDAADVPMAAMRKVTGGVLGAAETEMDGLALERNLRSGTAFSSPAGMETGTGGAAILASLDRLYERLGRLQIVLDTGTLVGETIDKIDAGLGDRQLLRARGV